MCLQLDRVWRLQPVCGPVKLERGKSRHADILVTIFTRKSARMSVSVSVPWNSSLRSGLCRIGYVFKENDNPPDFFLDIISLGESTTAQSQQQGQLDTPLTTDRPASVPVSQYVELYARLVIIYFFFSALYSIIVSYMFSTTVSYTHLTLPTILRV